MRSSGILLAVSSLPSRHGIGDFGASAYQFISYLKKAKMPYWQMLPLNPLGYGNSPYQPYSSKALEPLYLNLDKLKEEGLIHSSIPDFNRDATRVDYDAVRDFKEPFLKEAFSNFVITDAYIRFLEAQPWVRSYAIFMAFKRHHQLNMWTTWDKEFKSWIAHQSLDLSPYEQAIQYECFLQYQLLRQFHQLKAFAKQEGVQFVGDIPIYVGIDSSDVWTQQSLFMLDDQGEPTHIAGVPPDYFSPTGQRWGNPLYRWDVLEKTNFAFWIDRLAYNATLFDVIRIDHFRAFDTYWKIPVTCPTAVEGAWIEAPGYALFHTIQQQLPHVHIIAEDLGDLRPEVLQLRDYFRLPGMKILQFDIPIYPPFENPPDNKDAFPQRFVAYTGTHDNQTVMGWYPTLSSLSKEKLAHLLQGFNGTIAEKMVQLTLAHPAELAVIPMQDLLSYDDEARMNTPGTIGSPNWEWKLASFRAFDSLIVSIQQWIQASGR